MMRCIITGFILLFLNVAVVYSQEMVNGDTGLISGPEDAGQASAVPEMQWLWGEVSFVDAARNQIVVKYLDYENDTEKEATIVSDDKTVFGNIKAIGELKEKDTVSIDYIVTADGVNMARNITVEKPEESDMSEPLELPSAGEEINPAESAIEPQDMTMEQPGDIGKQ